jgi:hypothetical protein
LACAENTYGLADDETIKQLVGTRERRELAIRKLKDGQSEKK